MGKPNLYYLVARDRLSDQFKIVPIHSKRGLSLEEIDLYTTSFQDEEDLAMTLREEGIIVMLTYIL